MTVMTVQVDIGAALKDGFATAFGQASSAAVKLDNAITAVDTRIATMKGWAAAKKETASAKEEWERATAKAKALGAQLAATANPTEDLKNKVAAARKEADQAKAAFVGAATGLKAMDVQLKAAGVSIKTVKVEMDAAEKSMAALTRRKEALNKAMAAKVANDDALSAVKGKALGTFALAGSMALPVHEAIQFETAMADVRKAVDFKDGGPGLKGMELAIKDMARTIPIAHEGLAAIVAAGGRMGIAEADLRTYTETVAKMSTAWEMAPDAAGESMGKIANIMGLAIGDLELVGDAINKLDDSSTAKAAEIVDVLKRTGGMGKEFGLNAQQIAALATSFLDLGSAPEVAGTSINALLMKLQSAPIQSDKFKESLKELGWSAEGMQQAIGKDAQGTLIKFLDTVKRLDKDTRINTLGEMFGAEYSDDMAKLVGGLDNYKKQLKLVGDQANYAGSMTAEFNTRSATTANQLTLTGNAVSEVGINIGTVLLPAVMDIAKGLAWASHGVASFAEAHPAMTKAVVFATAAFVAYKTIKLAAAFAPLTLKGAALAGRIEITKAGAAATIASTKFRGVGAANTGMARNIAISIARLRQFAGAANTAAASSGRLAAAQKAVGPLSLGNGGLSLGAGGLGKAARLGGKALGGAGLAISAGFAVSDLMDKDKSTHQKAGSVGNLAGGLAGAAAGAAIGSVVPVIGTVVGGIVGGLLGSYGGEALGGHLFKDKPGAPDADPAIADPAVNDNAVNDNGAADFEAPKVAKNSAPVYHQTFTINIYAQPGQSPEAIAGAVKKSFQGAASGGELYDK